ncbi:MAG: cell division protein FtsZ, partial [Novosphingobium sp.]|nr:cell division protein FtsZ [Novosphingobium sp.]
VMAEMGKAMMGTGEGSGENRALEAAEKAIANPLLDGVSMQGAKGVIISIIGGDDMKLLEVDEAANHIRELVDPNANIIWGSAFNPDLQGKIRVSVVATGIEQNAAQAEEAAGRPFNLGMGRGPARPAPIEAPVAVQPLFERTAPAPAPEPEPEPEIVAEPEAVAEATADEPQAEPDPAASYSDDDDWDLPEAQADDGEAGPLELELEADEPAGSSGGSDELLLDASRLVEEDQPVAEAGMPGRRRGLVSSDSGETGGAAPAAASPGSFDYGEEAPPAVPAQKAPRLGGGGGATLFERMANLSRGGRSAKDEDEDDEDGDGPSISIPRFLGRQNNQ